MSPADKALAIAALATAFCVVMSLVQWTLSRYVWAGYLFGLLALPITWVVTR